MHSICINTFLFLDCWFSTAASSLPNLSSRSSTARWRVNEPAVQTLRHRFNLCKPVHTCNFYSGSILWHSCNDAWLCCTFGLCCLLELHCPLRLCCLLRLFCFLGQWLDQTLHLCHLSHQGESIHFPVSQSFASHEATCIMRLVSKFTKSLSVLIQFLQLLQLLSHSQRFHSPSGGTTHEQLWHDHFLVLARRHTFILRCKCSVLFCFCFLRFFKSFHRTGRPQNNCHTSRKH